MFRVRLLPVAHQLSEAKRSFKRTISDILIADHCDIARYRASDSVPVHISLFACIAVDVDQVAKVICAGLQALSKVVHTYPQCHGDHSHQRSV